MAQYVTRLYQNVGGRGVNVKDYDLEDFDAWINAQGGRPVSSFKIEDAGNVYEVKGIVVIFEQGS